MKKTILTLSTIILATSFAVCQTLDDGIKFLYYEKNKSAVQALEKVVAGNPKDAKSIYWLGQAYINTFGASGDKADLQKAKSLYEKALTDGVNDPWIWVGSGHVQILESNDVNSAKQKFEQAITAVTPTKGKSKGIPDADILNAIGRANADGGSSQGDPTYGIEKLKQAAQTNLTNPDIDMNLGICYLKLGADRGGEAVEAFQDAIHRNAQYAKAYYRIGRIYESQNNLEYMNENFGKAIAADPTYAPVYLEYFNYYKEKDVNAAKEYLDKYVANADQDCSVDYFVADYLYRAGKNQESIAKAQSMENGACKDYIRINILYAYNYDKLGDSVKAKSYLDKYFAANPQKIDPRDYVLAAKVYLKFPGYEDTALNYVFKAVENDTATAKKAEYLNTASQIFGAAKKPVYQLKALLKLKEIKGGKLSGTEWFYITKASVDAKDCAAADTLSKGYIAAYPDLQQGYSFNVSAAKMCDVDTTKGLAVEPINNYNNFLMKDTAKNKKAIFNNYYYLLVYYAQYAKDLQKGVDMCDSMQVIYPDPNSEEYKFADTTKKQLQAALQKKTGNGTSSGATQSKPTSGGTK